VRREVKLIILALIGADVLLSFAQQRQKDHDEERENLHLSHSVSIHKRVAAQNLRTTNMIQQVVIVL